MEINKRRILIVGGYGLVGSNIARLIRNEYKSIELILAGRNPQNGDALAEELTNAETAYLNLKEGFNLSHYGKLDLVITAMEDRTNALREAAISSKIASIHISELAEEISPTMFLSLHQTFAAPIVLAAHWQAGIMTLVAKHVASKFSHITRVDSAGVYDRQDPIGPLVANELDGFVGKAFLRKEGKWQFVDATEESRILHLHDGSSITAFPMSTLDVPSMAAFTGSSNVRFDFAIGASIGTKKGLAASHDLYIDIEGVLLSGKTTKIRYTVSDPKGQAHSTAVGVFLITEGVLGMGGQSAPTKGGIYLPETVVPAENIISRLREFGLTIIEEDTLR